MIVKPDSRLKPTAWPSFSAPVAAAPLRGARRPSPGETSKVRLMRRRDWTLAVPLGLLAACRPPAPLRIAMIPQGQTQLYWRTIHAGGESAARELGLELVWEAPLSETDQQAQRRIVESMVAAKVQAICLSPIDQTALVPAVERAAMAGIPVIIFDSGIEADAYTAWIETDNEKAGRTAADRVGELLQGQGTVGMVAGHPGVASTLAREKGFEASLGEKFPSITIRAKVFGYADPIRCQKAVAQMLAGGDAPNVIFASNEAATAGAMQALEGGPPPVEGGAAVKLVGFDWSPALVDGLKSGVVDSLVAQDPFEIGRLSVYTALNASLKKPVERIQKLPARLIRKEELVIPEVDRLLHPDLARYLPDHRESQPKVEK